MLPNTDFPIIFDKTKGNCQFSDPSYFNMEEAQAVVGYIEKLSRITLNGQRITQRDIGVVTPYAKQVQVIRDMCSEKDFDEIMIATAEIYQGQEKPIIIISTVRTDGILGFVDNARVSPKLILENANIFNVSLNNYYCSDSM